MLNYIHKEEQIDDVERFYPAKHYVMIDDKLRIIDVMKNIWGEHVTTVFPNKATLMIADKSLLHRKWPADSDRRQRHLYDGYAVQGRDLNVGQQSLIRGSSRMTLLRLGLPLSMWRASKAHNGDEGSQALSRPQRRIPRRG